MKVICSHSRSPRLWHVPSARLVDLVLADVLLHGFLDLLQLLHFFLVALDLRVASLLDRLLLSNLLLGALSLLVVLLETGAGL